MRILVISFFFVVFVSILGNRLFLSPDREGVQSLNIKKRIFPEYLYSIRNFIFYKLNISADFSKVVVGRNGWLFLGDYYERVLTKSCQNTMSGDELNAWADAFLKRQEMVEANGSIFVTFIVPNKHSVYSHVLNIQKACSTNDETDAIFEVGTHNGVKIFDLRGEVSNGRQTFYKYDSHWNTLGAASAYDYILDSINKMDRDLKLRRASYVLRESSEPSLRRTGNAKLLKIENLIDLTGNVEYEISINNAGKEVSEYKFVKANYTDKNFVKNISINDETNESPELTLFENQNAVNRATVLWLRDSFGSAHSHLINATFDKVYVIHYYWLAGPELENVIRQIKPQIVMQTVVERQLRYEPLLH